MSFTFYSVTDQTAREGYDELRFYRRLSALAGSIYLFWWLAVHLTFPLAFNPFLSRLCVVAFIFAALALSYVSSLVRRYLRCLFIVGVWLITLHYYYLFYENAGDPNWVVGSFITVTAICFCFFSNVALLTYSIYVVAISLALVVLLPSLGRSVFLPGLVTILIQANVSLRSRLGLIKTLADSNHRFQLLFNSTFEGILVHREGLITDVNESLIRLLGFSRAELLGSDVLRLIQADQKDLVAAQMRLPDAPPYETKALTKDGAPIDIEVRSKNFVTENRTARLVAVKDITDRLRAEKERVAALTMKENVRVRDDFISIASHELKTPISALKLQTQLIDRDLRRQNLEAFTPVKVREFIDLFNRQLNRLTELVETMLDVSRISANRLVMEKQIVDLVALVCDVVASSMSPVPIEVLTPDSAFLQVDQSRIKQVIENLLNNAIKYGNERPIRIEIRNEASRVFLIVEDKGLGIDSAFTERIFERFERAISPRNISGLGLGLYIVRQIVEAHGGHISVQSTLGAGSIFTVELPR